MRTGNGVHIWWLFKEPWIFASAEDRQAAAAFVSRWHTLLRDTASQHGWSYERLADLARVLRVPGTTNCKDPVNPKPVVIYTQTDLRYNPSDLTEYLDEFGVADDDAEPSAGCRDWAERFKDTPITINLAARIPEDMLNRWLESDMRFKNTWFRQRHDLRDQSQSGYDLALCNFGFSNRLSEQQIVDLLIHHRALHKQKHRTRVEYFQRGRSRRPPRRMTGTLPRLLVRMIPVPAQRNSLALLGACAGGHKTGERSKASMLSQYFARSKSRFSE